MKKLIMLFLLCFIFLTCQLQYVYSYESRQEEASTITVSATASEEFPPDTAIVVLAVETVKNKVSTASSQNKIKARNIIQKIKSLLKLSNGKDNIKTSSFSVSPVYEYDKFHKKRALKGYMVRNQITVTTQKLDNVGLIMDTAINNGANRVHRVNFFIKDSQKYLEQVYSKAAKTAKHRADAVARTLGVKITGIKNINLSNFSSPIYTTRAMYASDASAMAKESSVTPIEPGNLQLNGNVNIIFYVEE